MIEALGVGVQLRFEFGDVFVGQTELVIGDGELVVGLVFEVEEGLGIGGGEGVEAGDLVGREAEGVGEVLLEANGLVVAAIVEQLVEKLEGGEEVVLFQEKVHHAVAQRRTFHLHSHSHTHILHSHSSISLNWISTLFASSPSLTPPMHHFSIFDFMQRFTVHKAPIFIPISILS